MKLTYNNQNYAATIVQVDNLKPLEGLDNLLGFEVFGHQALVSKNTKIGDLGVVFTAETQLSHDFCFNNNLYRKSEHNKDQSKTGYIDHANRRIKAVKFRGNSSNALLMEIGSLSYLNIKLESLQVGNIFDNVNGEEICQKYEIKKNNNFLSKNKIKGKNKKFNRVDSKTFPEHVETDNYWKNKHLIREDDFIIISCKIHGTSFRVGNIKVNYKPTLFRKLFKREKSYYDLVFGTRRTIKNCYENISPGFYGDDLWLNNSKIFEGKIPKNWIIYGEIIGWTPSGKEIQKGYTYGIPIGNSSSYIYRISIVNDDGYMCDLTYDQIMEWCNKYEFNYVPELWRGYHKDFNVDDWVNKRFFDEGNRQCLPLSNSKTVDEGVVIRRDGIKPVLLKAKSSKFLEHETKLIDSGQEILS